jgi:mannonate dehydratase
MKSELSRRMILRAAGAGAFAGAAPVPAAAQSRFAERADTPKLCLEMGRYSLAAGAMDDAAFRRIRQLGVDHVLSGGPRMP